MTAKTVNTKLYEKMFAEQERYRAWLLSQPPEEILNHTYEYTMREDILMALECSDLPPAQAGALLRSPAPLAEAFRALDRTETNTTWTISAPCWRTAPKTASGRNGRKRRRRRGSGLCDAGRN